MENTTIVFRINHNRIWLPQRHLSMTDCYFFSTILKMLKSTRNIVVVQDYVTVAA